MIDINILVIYITRYIYIYILRYVIYEYIYITIYNKLSQMTYPLSCFNKDFTIKTLISVIIHNDNNIMNKNA